MNALMYLMNFEKEAARERGKVCRDIARIKGKTFGKPYKVNKLIYGDILLDKSMEDLMQAFDISEPTVHRYRREIRKERSQKLLEWKAAK